MTAAARTPSAYFAPRQNAHRRQSVGIHPTLVSSGDRLLNRAFRSQRAEVLCTNLDYTDPATVRTAAVSFRIAVVFHPIVGHERDEVERWTARRVAGKRRHRAAR